MRPGKRFGLPAIEKRDIWSRWKAGQSLHEIGRAFDKPHSSIRCLLLPRGGMAWLWNSLLSDTSADGMKENENKNVWPPSGQDLTYRSCLARSVCEASALSRSNRLDYPGRL